MGPRIGLDLVSVEAVEQSIAVHGDRYLIRTFTDDELRECGGRPDRLAARFAAKEAVSKCFTTGIGAELGWRSVSVYHGERNQPFVRLDEKGEALLREAGATHVLLTLSHTETMAMAVAALVRA